jgi:L-alanine-DL-glutamate epimerase-like enolase superfamily enzyme
MRITRIRAWRQDQPFRDGPYRCSGGRSADGFESLIVALDAGTEVRGWGEMSPLGAFYDPAFAAGARAASLEIGPLLLGEDAAQPAALLRRMDRHMNGHPYAKSAFDMAAWDALARASGLPLVSLLGGRYGTSVDLYRSISQEDPARMAARARRYIAEGYRRLQVKVGLDPDEDIARIFAVREAVGDRVPLFADANGGWTTFQARRFLRATRSLDYVLEQPCASYAECKALRGDCDRPLVLDESIDTLAALVQAHTDQVADGITIKIARVGGVTTARLMRDVAVALGMMVTVEDTGGADIDTAAMLHLSLSTPIEHRLHTVDFHNWVTVSNATGLPETIDGTLGIGAGPGLGISVREEALGAPFLDLG